MVDYNAPPNSCTFAKVQKKFGLSSGLSNGPNGINKSIDQPSTSYMARGEKEKKNQKDDN